MKIHTRCAGGARRLLMLSMLFGALAPAIPATAQLELKTPPAFLIINAKPVRDENLTYNFEVTISKLQTAQGLAQLNVVTSITRVGDDQTVRIRDIRQTISPDALVFTIAADGKEFRLEAEYLEPSEDKTAPGRVVPTTYGVMFQGGRVGISVRRTS